MIWARTRIFSLFMRPPEEILHHCIHSSVPFGVAGRLMGKIIAYFARLRKWVKPGNASSIYSRPVCVVRHRGLAREKKAAHVA